MNLKIAFITGLAICLIGCKSTSANKTAVKDIVTTPSNNVSNPGNYRAPIGWECADFTSGEGFGIETYAQGLA